MIGFLLLEERTEIQPFNSAVYSSSHWERLLDYQQLDLDLDLELQAVELENVARPCKGMCC